MQMNAESQKKEQAFTLVELLITVAIIAILASLTIAGSRRFLQAAEGATNLSNHRTIAAGLLAYASEHKSRLPWGFDLASDAGTSDPYPKTLFKEGYISDGRVFFNSKFWRRSENKEGGMLVITNPGKYANSIYPWANTTYGANRYGAMPRSNDSRNAASLLKVATDGNLSKLMLTRDVYAPLNNTPANRRGGGNWWFANEGFLPEENDTYAGMVHASFADGHAEAFTRETMLESMQSGTNAPLFNNVYTLSQ